MVQLTTTLLIASAAVSVLAVPHGHHAHGQHGRSLEARDPIHNFGGVSITKFRSPGIVRREFSEEESNFARELESEAIELLARDPFFGLIAKVAGKVVGKVVGAVANRRRRELGEDDLSAREFTDEELEILAREPIFGLIAKVAGKVVGKVAGAIANRRRRDLSEDELEAREPIFRAIGKIFNGANNAATAHSNVQSMRQSREFYDELD